MHEKLRQKQHIQNSEKAARTCSEMFFILFIIYIGFIFAQAQSDQASHYSVPVNDILLLFLTIFFILVTVIALTVWHQTISSQKENWLKSYGEVIQATVINSGTTTYWDEINKRTLHSGYILFLEWTNPQTGRTHKFSTTSNSSSILRPRGSFVPVEIDPDDPTFCYRVRI
jgi:hypothetical protein